jgi:hypothetical protein
MTAVATIDTDMRRMTRASAACRRLMIPGVGHLKHILKLGRLRLRGPNGAKDEFLLAAPAQNLRKLGKLVPFPEPIFVTCGGSGPALPR